VRSDTPGQGGVLVQAQLRALEPAIGALLKGADSAQAVRSLMLLTGVGWVSAWVLVMELFGWRALTNRRQLASLAGWSHRRTTGAA